MTWWDWLAANSPQFSLLATVITAVVAVFALGQSARDLRSRTRPVVLAEFQKPEHSTTAIDFVVRNVGASVAHDLNIKFEPDIKIPDKESTNPLAPTIVKRYSRTIPVLGPGEKLRNVWYQAGFSDQDELIPKQVDIHISYKSEVRLRGYQETFSLDVDTVLLTTYAVGSDSMLGCARTSSKALKSIADSENELVKVQKMLHNLHEGKDVINAVKR